MSNDERKEINETDLIYVQPHDRLEPEKSLLTAMLNRACVDITMDNPNYIFNKLRFEAIAWIRYKGLEKWSFLWVLYELYPKGTEIKFYNLAKEYEEKYKESWERQKRDLIQRRRQSKRRNISRLRIDDGANS